MTEFTGAISVCENKGQKWVRYLEFSGTGDEITIQSSKGVLVLCDVWINLGDGRIDYVPVKATMLEMICPSEEHS